ncbi:unnamed protein product [Ilex paraguariensis]|uniref:GT-1/4-like C-terminal domain-containing protein n=1 Tax=Ilex paraguariensis TaxID=185542 RepID=A0ABC8SX81_9AQUA
MGSDSNRAGVIQFSYPNPGSPNNLIPACLNPTHLTGFFMVLRMAISHLDQWKTSSSPPSTAISGILVIVIQYQSQQECGCTNGRSTVNLDRPLDHDGDPLAITTADAVAASGVPPWNWRETTGNGGEGHSAYGGRVITVKWGEYIRRIGVDGTADAIKEALKSAFGLRTKRAFWLEDEDNVVRSLDRDMPLGNYALHLDEGVSIKVCLYDDPDRLAVRTEDKTLYSEGDFRDFLSHRGLIGLREINGYRSLDNLDDLRPGAMYQGVRLLGD